MEMLEDREVVKVEQKTTANGKTMYMVTLSNKGEETKYNVFNSTHASLLYASLTQNKPVQVGFRQNGEYTNIVEVMGEAEPSEAEIPKFVAPTRSGGFGGGKADPNKLHSIERQVAMKCGIELATQGVIEMKTLLPTCDKIYKWLSDY